VSTAPDKLAALVSFTIGETGRSGAGRARSARAGQGPDQEARAAPQAQQWSTLWSGERPGPVRRGCEGEPDLALALSPEDARLVAEGKLAPSVAFMQGRLKTSGDNGALLEVLAWSATPAFVEALAEWRRAGL